MTTGKSITAASGGKVIDVAPHLRLEDTEQWCTLEIEYHQAQLARLQREQEAPPLLDRIAIDLAAAPRAADERYFCADLRRMEMPELERERRRLEMSTAFADRPDPWALQRLRRIELEVEARRPRERAGTMPFGHFCCTASGGAS